MSSRVFQARTTSGACYFCARAFEAGSEAFYMTAFAAGEAPERPLTPAELAEWRRLGRQRREARTRQERARIVSPGWLWDRMVHPACAQAAGFPVPGAETTAQLGRRTVGYAHGSAAESTPAPVAPAVSAPARRPVPAWVASMSAAPDATREREAAIAARAAARLAVSTPAPAVSAPAAPAVDYAPGSPRPGGLSRVAHVLLDVFEGEAPRAFEPRPETGPVVRALDLD